MPVNMTKSTDQKVTDLVAKARQCFNVESWAEGYFAIGDDGRVLCRPRCNTGFALLEIVQAAKQAGLELPVLLRFPDVLTDRVQRICRAFDEARAKFAYQGAYTLAYPIKVNQQRCVVEHIVSALPGRVGLEAGSKSELMAVLAQTFQKQHTDDVATIICNGYKDREYIRLALIGAQLGKRVFIVVEQPDELTEVLRQAQQLAVRPLLGVRVRLDSIAKGKWQNTGGEKSKFGVSATELLKMIATLRQSGQLDCLQLLHCHVGSQVADITDLSAAISEISQYYCQLHKLGVAISIIDIGGGLGVDYEGSRSDNEFSMNYDIKSYADEVVNTIAKTCEADGLKYPEIISESGRALTAHHAVLITKVLDVERSDAPFSDIKCGHSLAGQLQTLIEQAETANKLELAEQVVEACRKIQQRLLAGFLDGSINLQDKSCLDSLLTNVHVTLMRATADNELCLALHSKLQEKLADKFFCNFSLFQSLPDIWALQQVFPILPLQRLNEPLTRQAVIHDLTCDSDGQIGTYPLQAGLAATLPVHKITDDEEYCLGIFMLGAYQEILGDLHNLFGDTNSVNIVVGADGKYELAEIEPGDRIDQLLEYVHYNTSVLLQQYKAKLADTQLSDEAKDIYYKELEAGLSGYTYLEE